MNRQAIETGWAFLAPIFGGGAAAAASGSALVAAGASLSKMMAQVGITVGLTVAVDYIMRGYSSPEEAEQALMAEAQQNAPLNITSRAYYLGQWDNWAASAKKHVPEPALSKIVEPAWHQWRKKNIEAGDATLLSYSDAARAIQMLIDRYGADTDIQATIAKSASPPVVDLPPGATGPMSKMWMKKYGVILGLVGAAGLWYAYARRSK